MFRQTIDLSIFGWKGRKGRGWPAQKRFAGRTRNAVDGVYTGSCDQAQYHSYLAVRHRQNIRSKASFFHRRTGAFSRPGQIYDRRPTLFSMAMFEQQAHRRPICRMIGPRSSAKMQNSARPLLVCGSGEGWYTQFFQSSSRARIRTQQ